MKKLLLLCVYTLFALAAAPVALQAQHIVFGERVPEVKVHTWLRGQRPTTETKLTYIEFFDASNKACISSLAQLKALCDRSAGQMQLVVVARENADDLDELIGKYLAPNVSVALDADGKVFAAFEVRYVPFGVLIDTRRRALWMGNSLQLTPEIIVKSSK